MIYIIVCVFVLLIYPYKYSEYTYIRMHSTRDYIPVQVYMSLYYHVYNMMLMCSLFYAIMLYARFETTLH